jgi:polyisoprenyl-phosphate glycosyltransferase
VVNAYLQLEERNRFFRGMVAWLGFKHVELTFIVAARAGSPSRWSLLKLIALAIDASTSFSSKPLQLVILMGVLFMLGAGVLAVWVMIQFVTGTAIGGFTTVILLQLIVGSILMLGLGLIGIYLAKIYDEVKNRPSYIINETVQSTVAHSNEKTDSNYVPKDA